MISWWRGWSGLWRWWSDDTLCMTLNTRLNHRAHWFLSCLVWFCCNWHYVYLQQSVIVEFFVLIVVMFGLASLQLTQWISSTKCVWWSNFSSWWYWFSLMTLSKIQQFLEFLKRKTGIFLTASSGFNVQEDHLWHLPPTWQKPCIISESWNFLGCPYGAGEFAMSWVLLAMNGPSHQVFTICATLGCFCSGWTWWSSCAVTNVKKKWRKKSKNWMVS
jgi:hypothetical protein